jgi:hypothetical protein
MASGTATENKRRLAHALRANVYVFATLDVRDFSGLERLSNGVANIGLGTTNESLAVAEVLSLRVETAVDDMHGPA